MTYQARRVHKNIYRLITKTRHGKAEDIDRLPADFTVCHPSVCVILSKLFQVMLLCSSFLDGFRYNYIVRIPKPKECFSKAFSCDDFRGIAISPVISKIFQHSNLASVDFNVNRFFMKLFKTSNMESIKNVSTIFNSIYRPYSSCFSASGGWVLEEGQSAPFPPAGGSEERCNRIWCILSLKMDIWWQQF